MMTTIAIGDVHGRADLLEPLLDLISNRYGDARIVFLGDIIDRGPDSKECLEMVREELARNPASALILGNHEDLMLRFVDYGLDGSRSWCWNGGLATVASYGYHHFEFMGDDGYLQLPDQLADIFRAEQTSHIALIRKAVAAVELPDFLLVHAGIVPGVPMDQQDPYQLRWNSKDLIAYDGPLPKTVVHGHKVTATLFPEVYSNRIAIDCGAYESGVLCAVVLDDSARSFILSTAAAGCYEIETPRPSRPMSSLRLPFALTA